jgi:hypothetical protein
MKRWILLAALSIALAAAISCGSDEPEPTPTSVPIPIPTVVPSTGDTPVTGGNQPPNGSLDTSKTYTPSSSWLRATSSKFCFMTTLFRLSSRTSSICLTPVFMTASRSTV